ncbi:MAG TPA: hypothetical protein VK817_09375 [Trebonia sp.]|jgi:hypothetical protein|nr:hypothetical protein [Trebonia sp.]
MTEKPVDARELLAARSHVITSAQGARAGLSEKTIRNHLRGKRWQRVERGVYATFTGEPDRAVRMWAALLRAGPGAVFSHQTAAEIQGFLGQPCALIHVTVPADRHPARWSTISGVVVHRSGRLARTRHPTSSVPFTRVEDTVLDLIAESGNFGERFDWIACALRERRTTPQRLHEALRRRPKFPGRRDAEVALGYASEGIMSWLELQWVTGVERPHGLPAARRQIRVAQDSGNRYLDNLYARYRLCVELDGRAAHPESERRRDNARDRWNLAYEHIATLRFDSESLHDQRGKCRAAAELARIFRAHDPGAGAGAGTGADAVGHPCGDPDCGPAFAAIVTREPALHLGLPVERAA